MNNSLPKSADYLIIGAGIHGLSTALHLAQKQSDKSIVVIDKSTPGAGATGIACGVVRNNYYQPAMRKLMAHSVGVWEKYAKELHYNSVGYMQISMEKMHQDVATIYQQQQQIGYNSQFIEGEKQCDTYMKNLFHDWQATGVTSILHEQRGGFSHNKLAVNGLVKLATDAGVTIVAETEVTALKSQNTSDAINIVQTSNGDITVDQVVVAPGPWVKTFWDMLELPNLIQIKGSDGKMYERDMWHYWMLQEGVLDVDPNMQKTNDGGPSPVLHVDLEEPLYSDKTGKLLTAEPWGIYYKPDNFFNGIQGGFAPYELKQPAENIAIDPYGQKSTKYLVTEEFIDIWCSALAFCQKRFVGLSSKYRREPSGGLGCLTPDSFPVFDRFKDNVYIIADANHGYKMLGVGALVADELTGQTSNLLEPFRFDRYKKGQLHPLSNSPFPWS